MASPWWWSFRGKKHHDKLTHVPLQSDRRWDFSFSTAPLESKEGIEAKKPRWLRSCHHYCHHDGMIRRQVQLTPAQIDVLQRRARRENVSVAELVRQAVDAFTRADPPAARDIRDRAIRAAGRFASGVDDTSSRHDTAVADAFRAQWS
jgi:hypothetical protein